MAADFMVAFCPHCSEPLYRSNRPMEPGQRGEPSDFTPIAEHIPPPEGETPVCYECGGALKVVPESALRSSAQRAASGARQGQAPATVTQIRKPTAATPGFEVLFECVDGEQIVNVGKDPGGMTIILTNRRIIRLNM